MSTAQNRKKQRSKLRSALLDLGLEPEDVGRLIAEYRAVQDSTPPGPAQPVGANPKPDAIRRAERKILEAAAESEKRRPPVDDPDLAAKLALADASREGRLTDHTRRLYEAQPDQPDDQGYRPTYTPPELRGHGRATGQAAAAIKRGTTITDWQHRNRDAS